VFIKCEDTISLTVNGYKLNISGVTVNKVCVPTIKVTNYPLSLIAVA
jgi:hypothetical protein